MQRTEHILFSSGMKLADILLKNYTLLSVLPRFGIPLGFGEKSVADVCHSYGINERFFLLVCNVHTYDDYLPNKKELEGLQIESLVDYLHNSHSYYTEDKIASIRQKIEQMESTCQSTHYQIIRQFFAEYQQEVVNHFQYEEETVFPYITALAAGRESVNYHINQYEENHSNIEDKLSDLKNIIIKYLPGNCASDLRNNLLFDIFLFEEDLIKHARIENKILIPFVAHIEKSHEK